MPQEKWKEDIFHEKRLSCLLRIEPASDVHGSSIYLLNQKEEEIYSFLLCVVHTEYVHGRRE